MATLQQTRNQAGAIEQQTKAMDDSSQVFDRNLRKIVQQGIEKYDQIPGKTIWLFSKLVHSNIVNPFIRETVLNFLIDKEEFISS